MVHSYRFKCMGCPCELRLYPPAVLTPNWFANACRIAVARAWRFERRYSRFRSDSLVAAINRSAVDGAVVLDAEARALFDYAAQCFTQSAGAFDITSGALRRVWARGRTTLPTATEITTALGHVGWQRVAYDGASIRLPHAGMQVDLGGVVKEYAADAIVALLREQGIEHGLVDLGGDVALIGPHPDGAPWRLGVRHPQGGPGRAIAYTDVTHGGVATSGNYERYVQINGTRYSHVVDARTGIPVTGLLSVTVLAPATLVAGSIATLALLQAPGAALRWLGDTGLRFVAVDQQLNCHTEAG